MAPTVPTTPPVRLSKTDSIRIIRTTRQRPQPIARKMPISLVRSKTDITMVFNMPTAPITNATAEVIQAMAWTKLDFGGRVDELGGGRGFDVLAQRLDVLRRCA